MAIPICPLIATQSLQGEDRASHLPSSLRVLVLACHTKLLSPASPPLLKFLRLQRSWSASSSPILAGIRFAMEALFLAIDSFAALRKATNAGLVGCVSSDHAAISSSVVTKLHSITTGRSERRHRRIGCDQ